MVGVLLCDVIFCKDMLCLCSAIFECGVLVWCVVCRYCGCSSACVYVLFVVLRWFMLARCVLLC